MNKFWRNVLAMALVLPGFLFGAISAEAQIKGSADKSLPPTKTTIAIVDLGRVERESVAMKSARAQGRTMERKYEKEFGATEKRLRTEYKTLQATHPNVNPDTNPRKFQASVRTLNRLFVANRRRLALRRRLLQQGFRKVFVRFRQEVVVVVKSLAVEKNYTLVLTKATAIHNAPQFSITSEVVKQLNKRFSKVKLVLPKAPPTKGQKAQPTKKPKRAKKKRK